jgi:hypothetical protein
MSIFNVRFLPKYFRRINNDFGFTFDLIHIIIDVVGIGLQTICT